MLLIPGVLIALGPVVLHGMIKDGVTSWVPAYVTEIFQVEPAFAALVTTLLPIVNLSGAAAAKFVYERICRNEFGASAIFFGIATAALAVLLTLTGGSIEGAEAVNKSFPDFFDKLKALGIDVTTQ